jgi:hypothetical protein
VYRVIVSDRILNRTLLARQHLLARVHTDPLDMTQHLLGLQAQATLPPYLSLHARLADFHPAEFSRAIADRRIVRLLLMRGTVHAVTPGDAATLRTLVQPMLDKITRNSAASREAVGVPREELLAAGRAVLDGGPVSVAELGERLAERFPDVPGRALANTLRESMPLVQLPPRGLWNRSGGVVYDTLQHWIGPLPEPAPATDVMRRYLRAFGPATAADVAAWSRITGVAGILAELGDELLRYRTESGRTLLDLAGLSLTDPDTPAPARLLGQYDNVWLSHAGRDRVTTSDARKRWMGANGGVGNTVFLDGQLAGLWRRTRSGAVDLELFARPTRGQQHELDAEVAAVDGLLIENPSAGAPALAQLPAGVRSHGDGSHRAGKRGHGQAGDGRSLSRAVPAGTQTAGDDGARGGSS